MRTSRTLPSPVPASRLAGCLARAGVAAVLASVASAVAPLQAQEPAAATTSSPGAVAFRWNIEWISAARGSAPADTPVNPGNAALRLPQLSLRTEVRPNLRLEVGSRLQVVARPRLQATLDRAWVTSRPAVQHDDVSANWTELYASWRPFDTLAVAWGLQNFQWGPAELLSPSNRIFHETGVFKDPLYYVRGRHLVRVNLSLGRQWSLVTFGEVGATSENAFRAGERFFRAAQAKLEYATADGASYAGGVVGVREGSRPWVGGYGTLALSDGLSAYLDATVQRGSEAWYPVGSPRSAAFEQTLAEERKARWFGVAGLRYTFGRGTDVRLEYVHQDAGWSRGQLDLAVTSLGTMGSRTGFEIYAAPGLEFLGRRLALMSLHVPDLGPGNRLQAHARYLRSFTDGSGVGFMTASVNTSDALVLFASAAATHGIWTGEFARFVSASLVGGAVYAW